MVAETRAQRELEPQPETELQREIETYQHGTDIERQEQADRILGRLAEVLGTEPEILRSALLRQLGPYLVELAGRVHGD
jgi:hypothetical protein